MLHCLIVAFGAVQRLVPPPSSHGHLETHKGGDKVSSLLEIILTKMSPGADGPLKIASPSRSQRGLLGKHK